MSAKLALIIANPEYIDSGLAQLAAPSRDAEEFARILRSPEICRFNEVKVLLNQTSHAASEAIDEFFDQKKPDDLLLLYFSGHGVRDELGSLFLAVSNTNRFRLRSTAIKSDFIRESMDQSRSKRQILILDCCNSGAFVQGTKAAAGISIGTGSAFEGTGYGRVILTASDSTQFAWEGDRVIGETENSLFTHFLFKGLEGEADLNTDGHITVDELYDYTFRQILNVTPKQTPSKWSFKEQGETVLRESIPIEHIKSVPLPDDLLDEIDDPRTYVRQVAVEKLEKLTKGKNLGLARTAREALEKMAAEDDSIRIRQSALQTLMTTRQELEKTTQEQKAPEDSDEKREVEAETELPSTKDTPESKPEIKTVPPSELAKTSFPKTDEAGEVTQDELISPVIGDHLLENEKEVTSSKLTKTVEIKPTIESETRTLHRNSAPRKFRLLPITLAGGFVIIVALCGYFTLRSVLWMLSPSTPASTDNVTTGIAATQRVPATGALVDALVPTATARSTQTPRPTRSPTPQAQQFFTEEFDNQAALENWESFSLGSGEDTNLVIRQENDHLLFDLADEDLYVYYMYTPQEYDNVSIKLNAENLGRNNNLSLVCRMNSEGSQWYEFSVESGGLWYLYAVDEKYNVIANGGTNALKQGREVNEYAMTCDGDRITLSINDEEVRSVTDNTYGFNSGLVGFNISSLNVLPITVEVNWFEISQP